ncbi:MAG: DEAD/DEAH box helicase [Planctomycetota bacterium]
MTSFSINPGGVEPRANEPDRSVAEAHLPGMGGAYAPPPAWWRTMDTLPQAAKNLRGFDAAWDAVLARMVPWVPRTRRYLKRAEALLRHDAKLAAMPEAELALLQTRLREAVRRGRDTADDRQMAYAVVRELAARTIGLRAYPNQVAAALAMGDGCFAEVATGEGKTLVATMPAAVAAWRGRGVHVITANDYLAQRDAEEMRPVYEACGLSVGFVVGTTDPLARRAAYACDVTYTTNKEAAADFLRDRLVLGRTRGLPDVMLDRLTGNVQAYGGAQRMVQRGLAFAIVDEADAVLIDEGVTPLIISGEAPNAELTDAFEHAATLTDRFERDKHFKVNPQFRDVRMTNAGRDQLTAMTDVIERFRGMRRSEELITQAITAKTLFHPGQHYVVQQGKVVIVDEATGRLMPDRTWREGLHQAIEAKEGLEVTAPKDTLARISFQRFFRMYGTLCGMTGTAWEARHELWQTYRTPTVRIPTNRPCIRKQAKDRVCPDRESRRGRIADRVEALHQAGRPVLVGSRTIHESEALSVLLDQRGIPHAVLNAVRHEEEAEIVAKAGQPGAVTIATNMAGRGTDIKLGPGVSEAGGLHVIAAERNDARRIDRQLFGRAGRQGDPGSAEAIVAVDDEVVRRFTHPVVRGVVRRLMPRRLVKLAQRRAHTRAVSQRRGVLKRDQWLSESLGFAGVE